MDTTRIQVRVEKNLKQDAERIAEELGMTLSTAINLFLRQMVRKDGIPFDVSLTPNSETIKALESAKNEEGLIGPFHDMTSLMEALENDA